MQLSIITVNYNNKDGLEKTIKSVLSQTLRSNLEYIVVDGASTDGSVDVIDQYKDGIDKWVSEPDNGIYNAMNKGISLATGDYCLFLNSADVFCSSKSIERIINKRWYADVVQCDIFYKSFRDSHFLKRVFSPDRVSYYQFLKDSLYHQSSFLKTSMLKNEGYMENYRMVSDWAYFFKKLVIEGHTYQHLKVPITIFDMGGISNSGNPRDAAERLDFLSRYFSPVMLEIAIKQRTLFHVLDATYMSPLERGINRLLHRLISQIFYRVIYYPRQWWDNIRYIDYTILD